MNSSVFHLDEVVWCLLASFSPCLLEVLCEMRESKVNLVVREKQSENFVVFSNYFFPQIFQSVFICKILME